MKRYGEVEVIPFILNLSTGWRWMVSFTLPPLYSGGKTPPKPIVYDADGLGPGKHPCLYWNTNPGDTTSSLVTAVSSLSYRGSESVVKQTSSWAVAWSHNSEPLSPLVRDAVCIRLVEIWENPVAPPCSSSSSSVPASQQYDDSKEVVIKINTQAKLYRKKERSSYSMGVVVRPLRVAKRSLSPAVPSLPPSRMQLFFIGESETSQPIRWF